MKASVKANLQVNGPPVLVPIGDVSIDEQVPFTFTASATDPDVPADSLSYSVVGAPPGAH